MKLAFIADVHLANHAKAGGTIRSGLNSRARAIIAAIDDACRTAVEQDCEVLTVCGDLFDTVKPIPQLIAAVCSVFARHGTLTIYVLLGNHDMQSEDEGDHALGPLRSLANVWVIDKPTAHHIGGDHIGTHPVAMLLLPYRTAPVPEWIGSTVATLLAECRERETDGVRYPRVLALHAGISDAGTKHYLTGARDSVPAAMLGEIMSANAIEFAAAGNWHEHQSWTVGDAEIVQCGALVPTGFDNPGTSGYGSLIVYDTVNAKWSRTEIDGPRFLTVRGDFAVEAYREAAEKVPNGSHHVRYKGAPSQLGAMAATLRTDELTLGLASVEAVPDDGDYKAVRTAAAMASQAAGTNADDAVRAYVEAMPLDPSIDRATITQRVLDYL